MLVRGRQLDALPTHARDRMGVAFLCGYGSDTGRLLDDYQRTARRASAVVEQVFWS